MVGDICAVVLAAGQGRRLRPLTAVIPKALCPVGNVASLDRCLSRLAGAGFSGASLVAVNACHLAGQIVAHVGERAFVGVEPGPAPLGTAGALAYLRDWIAGRGVIAANSDAYLDPEPAVAALLDGWDGTSVRLLGVPAEAERPAEFGGLRFAGLSLIPARDVAVLAGPLGRLVSSPTQTDLVSTDLVSAVWRPAERAGRLEPVIYRGFYRDIGTPHDYLAANLHAAGAGSIIAADATVDAVVEHSVVGSGAVVRGRLTRCVVLPGGHVGPTEHLVDTVRAPMPGYDLTIR